MSQSSRITLASGQITPGDAIIVELVRASETPEAILVHWPSAPSVVTPARLTVTPLTRSSEFWPRPVRGWPRSGRQSCPDAADRRLTTVAESHPRPSAGCSLGQRRLAAVALLPWRRRGRRARRHDRPRRRWVRF